MSALLDTNVLIYASDKTSLFHGVCRELRAGGTTGRHALCVTPQVLLEYVAVVTNPRRVVAPRTPAEAWAEVGKLRCAFAVILHAPTYLDKLEQLATILQPKGAEVFDLSIAATMLAAGINEIYTYDSAVFGKVPGLVVRTP